MEKQRREDEARERSRAALLAASRKEADAKAEKEAKKRQRDEAARIRREAKEANRQLNPGQDADAPAQKPKKPRV